VTGDATPIPTPDRDLHEDNDAPRELLLVVPSRGRPANVDRLYAALRHTCTAGTQLLVCLDRDDADNYPRVPGIAYEVREPLGFVSWLNEIFPLYARQFRYLGSLGDDHVPLTRGWDSRVVEVLRELGTGLCYGNDLLQGERLPTACFMTSDIISVLGFAAPPELLHMFSDNFWLALGRSIRRIRYLPEVIIEHRHFINGKAEKDATYAESTAQMSRDQAAFRFYLSTRFEADAAKVRAFARPRRLSPGHDSGCT